MTIDRVKRGGTRREPWENPKEVLAGCGEVGGNRGERAALEAKKGVSRRNTQQCQRLPRAR